MMSGIAVFYDFDNNCTPSYKEIPITKDIVVPKNAQLIYAEYDEEFELVSVTILSSIDTESNLRYRNEPFRKFWFKLKFLLGITTEIESSSIILNDKIAPHLFKHIIHLLHTEDTSDFTQSVALIDDYQNFDGSKLFHVGCDCGTTEHTHTVFIDASEKEIFINSRLTQGYNHYRQLESTILLKPSGAANYAKLLSI